MCTGFAAFVVKRHSYERTVKTAGGSVVVEKEGANGSAVR